jgi:iron complex outermembrane recepter protein
MNNKRIVMMLMLGVSAVSFLIMSSSASAQVAEPAQEATDPNEIVVTATRRDASLQSVPLSISALSPDKITTLGIRSSNDIASSTPGLSFIDNGDGSEQLSVRGVVAIGGVATTAFYVDETPIAQRLGAAYSPRYFDIERVEVLRGPQGTLYGASSMGGAVRIITAKPNLTKFEGGIRAEGSTTRFASTNGVFDGAISIPIITDKLALRINGFYEKESGWIKRFRPDLPDDPNAYVTADGLTPGIPLTAVLDPKGTRTGDQKVFGGRAALRFDPVEAVSLTATYAYQERRNDGFTTADTAEGLGFSVGGLNQVRALDEFRVAKTQLANFTAQADLGFAKLTSSSSYQLDRQRATNDDTLFFLPVIVGITGSILENAGVVPKVNGVAGFDLQSTFRTKAFTQELRMVSASEGPLNWIIGGFYNSSNARIDQNLRSLGLEAILGPLTPADSVAQVGATIKLREISVFGELGYKFSDALSATVGLRRYDVSVKPDTDLRGLLIGPDQINNLPKAKERGFTYKAVLTYKPNNDLLFFGGVSTGYRPGSANTPSVSDFPIPSSYKSDKLTQYEFGWKTSWLDRKARFNGALFYIDWTDIPTGLVSPDGLNYTINGPKARNYGAELELELRPTKGLTFSTGLTILNAKYSADFSDPGLGVAIIKGTKLSTIPDVSINAAIGYEWALSDGIQARLNADVSHVSKRLQTADADSRTLPGSVTAGLSAGLSFEAFDVSVFARNIFDERALTGNAFRGFEILNGDAVPQSRLSYSQPRTIGASLSFKF